MTHLGGPSMESNYRNTVDLPPLHLPCGFHPLRLIQICNLFKEVNQNRVLSGTWIAFWGGALQKCVTSKAWNIVILNWTCVTGGLRAGLGLTIYCCCFQLFNFSSSKEPFEHVRSVNNPIQVGKWANQRINQPRSGISYFNNFIFVFNIECLHLLTKHKVMELPKHLNRIKVNNHVHVYSHHTSTHLLPSF